MPLLSLRRLVNWSLLRHVLAVVCLIIGARQLLLIREARLMRHVERYGATLEALKHYEPDRTRSVAEQISDLRMIGLWAWLAGSVVGVALSWLVVARRRERRAIPVLVLLITLLISRWGFYKSELGHDAARGLHWLFSSLALTPRLWLIGSFWVTAGLLLLLSTWPFRRAAVVQTAPAA